MKGNTAGACCSMGVCPRCHAGMWLVLGIIILVNVYWPFVSSWWMLIGWLLVIKGIMKMIMPSCPHCK